MPAGTMTGVRGAPLEVGAALAGQTRRFQAQHPRSLARCRAFGMRESLRSEPRWNADGRAPLARGEPHPKGAEDTDQRLSAFRFLFFLTSLRAQRSNPAFNASCPWIASSLPLL